VIRHRVSEAQLREAIDEVAPTWRQRAEIRTDQHLEENTYTGKSPSWSEIKPVYMNVQHDKCAYCERPLEDEKYGKLECDVEHFRPKNTVPAWPSPALAAERDLSYEFPTGAPLPGGYYGLAHSPNNYAVACKPCNTPLKHNYFPIEGQRVRGGRREVDEYDEERALLPFPLGERGTKPQTVIGFEGLAAVTRYRSGRRHRMGRVTIDFFDLNGREALLRQRAQVIEGLWFALLVRDDPGSSNSAIAQRVIDNAKRTDQPHTNCARAFIAEYERDPAHARALAEEIIDYLESGSG